MVLRAKTANGSAAVDFVWAESRWWIRRQHSLVPQVGSGSLHFSRWLRHRDWDPFIRSDHESPVDQKIIEFRKTKTKIKLKIVPRLTRRSYLDSHSHSSSFIFPPLNMDDDGTESIVSLLIARIEAYVADAASFAIPGSWTRHPNWLNDETLRIDAATQLAEHKPYLWVCRAEWRRRDGRQGCGGREEGGSR